MATQKATTDKPTTSADAGKSQSEGEQAIVIVPLDEMQALSTAVIKFDRLLEVSPDAVVKSATTALNVAVEARELIKSQSDANESAERVDDAAFICNVLMQMVRGRIASAADAAMLERYVSLSAAERQAFSDTLERAHQLADRLAQNTTSFQQWHARHGR